jgi:protein-tyrosine phosphatase
VAGGKHVRWGMIYRSGATPLLTDGDVQTVAGLNLAGVVDLRSSEERQLARDCQDFRVWTGG